MQKKSKKRLQDDFSTVANPQDTAGDAGAQEGERQRKKKRKRSRREGDRGQCASSPNGGNMGALNEGAVSDEGAREETNLSGKDDVAPNSLHEWEEPPSDEGSKLKRRSKKKRKHESGLEAHVLEEVDRQNQQVGMGDDLAQVDLEVCGEPWGLLLGLPKSPSLNSSPSCMMPGLY